MRCQYINKIYRNEENEFTIAVYRTTDTSVPMSARDRYLASRNVIGFTAVGYNLPLTDQIEVEMEGYWESGNHGIQYQVESFIEIVPRTKEGIIGYLSSGAINGVKEKTAEAIYRMFGQNTLEIMEHTPEKLLAVPGISERKLEGIIDSFGKNRVFRELMTFLAPYKITPKKVNLILQTFQDRSLEIIRKRPYMLCAVKGFGFLTVDQLGRQLGKTLNDPMRISGCIGYVLENAMKEGHLYLERETLVEQAEKILNKDLTVQAVTVQDIGNVLYRLVMQKSIVVDMDRVYNLRQFEAEEETASMIAKKLLYPMEAYEVELELEQAQRDLGIILSEQQKQAVRMVFKNPISIITGGPGTGKTTVLKVILYIHGLKCKSEVQLMAPTGRAARRMTESTGNPNASTMHMALGLLGEDYTTDFEYLEAGFVNVDESSMVDMHLAYEFFQRIKQTTRILLVGDVDQLPSVGAGDVFRELIRCGLIPVTVLDLVYRQGASSSIPVNAKRMKEGKTNLILGNDFQFIGCKSLTETADMVKRIYQDEIIKNGIDKVQILTPFRAKTEAGVVELNRSLEDIINPPVRGKEEIKIGKDVFRSGDKVLQNKNMAIVSNGDMGTIAGFVEDEEGTQKIQIEFSDDRQVEYEREQMEMIEHANAITVHKSQGSEFPVVIIPWVKAFYIMLKRNILYTAVTRAKAKVYLVGDWNAVCQAIHTDDSGKRKTMLAERIKRHYREYQRNEADYVEAEQLEFTL